MASNEENEENSCRGNEWEVVSLTASTYAAVPDPREAKLYENDKINTYGGDKEETSRALFMSRHFLFPPTQHENLPLELDDSEIKAEQSKHDSSNLATLHGGESSVEGDDELSRLQFFDGNYKKLSGPGLGFDEIQNLRESDNVKYDPSPDISEAPRIDEMDESGFPRGAWWKRRVSSVYSQAKEANAFWSIFIAAAVMGLVIIGKRWQQERWQVFQLKWQIGANDQMMSRMMGQMMGLKDMIMVGQRRGSLITSSPSN